MRRSRNLIVTLLTIFAALALQSAAPAKAANRLAISVTPAYLYFGNQIVGTTSPTQSVTIKNTGSADIKLGAITGSGEFVVRAVDCRRKTLHPNESCSFSVAFKPLTAAYKTGSATIELVAGGSNVVVTLTGYGITGTNLLLSPTFEYPLPKPVPWKGRPTSFTLGSNLDCSVGLSPYCSAKIKGNSLNLALSLTQSISRVGLIGDRYIFRLSSRARDIPAGGQYKVELILMNMYNVVVATKVMRFADGTHEFQTLMGALEADEQYSWVVFRITLQKPSGTAWFDNAELVKLP